MQRQRYRVTDTGELIPIEPGEPYSETVQKEAQRIIQQTQEEEGHGQYL